MTTPLKMLGVSGSLRKGSINTGLLRHVQSQIATFEKSGFAIDFRIANIDIPLFNQDLEVPDNLPAGVTAFKKDLEWADCILFATPEHNYSMPAALKNALDWGSRPTNHWKGKAAAMVGSGGGGKTARSQQALRQSGVFLDLHFVNTPEVLIAAFEQPMPSDMATGELKDDKVKERIENMVVRLCKLSAALKHME